MQNRLNNPDVSDMELSQRGVFSRVLASLKLPSHSTALSVSVGDGIWDSIAFTANSHIKKIVATDIVANPVYPEDVTHLRKQGAWEFRRVEAEKVLPLQNNAYDLVFHHDVIEHVQKPYLFLNEQHRVLKKGGHIVFGTPNLHRPANILKLIAGRLQFPVTIGHNEEIGDYIHIQEFYKEQLQVMLEEIGFKQVTVHYCFFGLYFLNTTFSLYPESKIGQSLCQYLICSAQK